MQEHRVEDVDPHHRIDGEALLRQKGNGIGRAGARQIGFVDAVGVYRGVAAKAPAFGCHSRIDERGREKNKAKEQTHAYLHGYPWLPL